MRVLLGSVVLVPVLVPLIFSIMKLLPVNIFTVYA